MRNQDLSEMKLSEIIRTHLMGVPHDEQYVYLEDRDWLTILTALEAIETITDPRTSDHELAETIHGEIVRVTKRSMIDKG